MDKRSVFNILRSVVVLNLLKTSILPHKDTPRGRVCGGRQQFSNQKYSCTDKWSILTYVPLRECLEVFFLAEVRVQEGEPLENALRRFKRKVQTEDIIKEVKRHSFYLKPGEKKRVKEALARKRNRKKVRKEQD